MQIALLYVKEYVLVNISTNNMVPLGLEPRTFCVTTATVRKRDVPMVNQYFNYSYILLYYM